MEITEKQKVELKKEFDAYDKDGDGFITFKDLRSVIGFKQSRKSLRSSLQELDTNKDGKIDFEEFLKAIQEAYKAMLDEMKEFDLNGDGVITAEELKGAFENLMDKTIDEELDDLFKEFNSNPNDKISSELILLILEGMLEALSVDEKAPEVEEFKKESPSTKEDIKKAFRKLMGNTIDKEVKEILKEVDLNNDGKIDVTDIAKLLFTADD